jgi:rfaE bifunctional protein nucleotidyltransferase chain/domain
MPDESPTTRLVFPSPKIVSIDRLLELRRQYREAGQKVVWTNGCFDLLHVGHVRNLQAARSHGDVLVIGVNGNLSVARLKGAGRPIVPASERAEIIAALECVTHVLVFDELTPEVVLARLQPDIHCKGEEYKPPHGRPVPEAGVVAAYGGRIEYLPLVPGLSTTDLVCRIRQSPAEEHHAPA